MDVYYSKLLIICKWFIRIWEPSDFGFISGNKFHLSNKASSPRILMHYFINYCKQYCFKIMQGLSYVQVCLRDGSVNSYV